MDEREMQEALLDAMSFIDNGLSLHQETLAERTRVGLSLIDDMQRGITLLVTELANRELSAGRLDDELHQLAALLGDLRRECYWDGPDPKALLAPLQTLERDLEGDRRGDSYLSSQPQL